MKKQHLIAGTIIGGLLLAATMHSTSTFALSDSSSSTDDPSTGAGQTDPTTTDPTTTDPSATPADTTPPDGTVAGGSTADQSADDSTAATSTTAADPTTTDPTTNAPDTSSSDPQTAGTDNQSADPSSSADPTVDNSAVGGNTTTIDNGIGGTSQSGDATVSDNNRGGNATTGDASGITTLLNAVASSDDLGSGGLQTFTLNLNGIQNGNIVLNPNQLLGGALVDPITGVGQNNVGGQNNTTINNNVDLSATSGDAAVTDNGRGGNATSGNATTEADIVNMIQSLISDQQAFLGVININGTLNGNILLPQSVIDQLLKQGGSGDPSDTLATNNINVNNNVNLAATSGTASVLDNGRGGDATSGNATTKLNIYNLINSQIVGGNVLLVFVNVMGNWYGLLMNAPAGTTSAALGGGITQSSQDGGDTSVPASQVFGTNNETINNNVTLTSTTGNATVSGNHRGGNATTGNASSVADIVNILGAQIDLTGWLGILIINVFGTWNGSLNIQPTATTSTGTSGGPNHNSGGKHHKGSNGHHVSGNGFAYYIDYSPATNPIVATAAHVMGDSIGGNSGFDGSKHVAVVYDHSKNTSKVSVDAILAGFAAAAAGAAGAARYFSLHRKKG